MAAAPAMLREDPGGRRPSGREEEPQEPEQPREPGSHAQREPEQADPFSSGDAAERRHFLEICYSLLDYGHDARQSIAWVQQELMQCSPQDLALWGVDPAQWLQEISVRAAANSEFLKLLPCADVCAAPVHPRAVVNIPDGHRVDGRNSSKVRSTLRQFVRDWAVEGARERRSCYEPMIEALLRFLPPSSGGARPREKPKVLCPGSGLGRLPFDLARCGYAAQGNEFSYHMILGSHFIFNRTRAALSHTIFPFVLSFANRRGSRDHLRPIQIPEFLPVDALPEDAEFSMASGEFVAVYERQQGAWDAVLTCFFLDTAKNVFLYIRTIAAITRAGGVWINLGPLLYHYADVEHEISIELSWEEVKPAVLRYFTIQEESCREATYTVGMSSLMRTLFRCVFFVAVRNAEPASGVSKPVF